MSINGPGPVDQVVLDLTKTLHLSQDRDMVTMSWGSSRVTRWG